MDHTDLLERTLQLLEESRSRYCVIGGQAVNAYAEPMVSLDLDLALGPGEVQRLEAFIGPPIRVERFEHSVNLSASGSEAVLWLCSEAASYVTGHSLIADGGLTAPYR